MTRKLIIALAVAFGTLAGLTCLPGCMGYSIPGGTVDVSHTVTYATDGTTRASEQWAYHRSGDIKIGSFAMSQPDGTKVTLEGEVGSGTGLAAVQLAGFKKALDDLSAALGAIINKVP